jgi:signal transduction histidine kinase
MAIGEQHVGHVAPAWPRPAPRWQRDAGLAVVIGVVQVVGTYLASRHQHGRAAFGGLAILLLVIGPAALVLRRRAPVAVLVTVFASTLLYDLLNFPRGPIFFALIAAFFNAVMSGHRRAAWATLLPGYVGFLWVTYLVGTESRPGWAASLGLAAWLLVLGTVSEVIRTRRERAVEVWRTRTEEARRRASEERLRIAQELHDVLAHNISLINVQAGVALHLLDEQPEQARSSLAAIKQASKDALGELRSVLDVLRYGDEEAPRAPSPTLARLDELVSRSEAAGLPVRASVEGSRRPLPPGVDLAGYRIVQEALTNIARHAGPATATVRVTYGTDDVIVEIDDDGRGPVGGPSAAPTGGGNGIPGMRERAAVLGGDLDAGPRPGGGFRVRARLPLQKHS